MRWWVYLVSGLVALTTASLTGGHFLYGWDSVNFALGVERIDVGAHRPHPPGYLALIACARVVSSLTSVPEALLIVSAVAAAASCVVIWELGRAVTRSDQAALLGWSVAVSSPLLWFHASIAEVYSLELLSSVLCAAASIACRLHPSTIGAVGIGAAFALAVLVKPSAAVLMAPLWLYTATSLRGNTRWRLVGAGVVGIGVGIAVLGSVVPLRDLVSLTQDQVAGTVQADARFNPLHLLNRRLRDVAYALGAAIGLGGMLAFAIRKKRPEMAVGGWTLVVWGLPYLLICVAVHFPKPGYALPLIAPLALWLAGGLGGRSTRASVSTAVVICALNLAQFTVRPWPPSASGGDRRYALKSTTEKLVTEANSLLRPSLASIRTLDMSVGPVVASVPAGCDVRSTALLVETGGLVTWRHAMYYLREPLVLRVGQRHDESLAAQRGELLVSAAAPQSRGVGCVGLVSQGRLALSGGAVVKQVLPGQTIYWAAGPSTVTWSRADGVVVHGAAALAVDGGRADGSRRGGRGTGAIGD